MKKLVLLLVVGMIVFSFLTAQAQTPIHITYGYWMSEEASIINAEVSVFNKTHPNIEVTAELVPSNSLGFEAKLLTSLAAGTCWDVFEISPIFFKDFVNLGALVDLTPYINKDHFDLSVYPKANLEEFEVNGKYYSLPTFMDTVGVYYNIDDFEKAGLKLPTFDWTWSEFVADAKALTIKDSSGKIVRYGVDSLNSDQTVLYPLALSAGATNLFDYENNRVNFDSPQMMYVFKELINLENNGYAAPPIPIGQVSNYFTSGKIAAMQFNGQWMFGYYAKTLGFKWGFAPIPIMDPNSKYRSITNSIGPAIWSGSTHKEAAWEFVKFISDKEAQTMLGEGGIVIPTYKGLSDLWANSFKNTMYYPYAEIAVKTLNLAQHYPVFAGQSRWENTWVMGFTQILAGQQPVDYLKQLNTQINNIIQGAQ